MCLPRAHLKHIVGAHLKHIFGPLRESIAFFSSSHLYIALQNQQELEKKQEQDEKLLSPCHWLVEGRGNDTLQWA
jgi:hypothetical protein